MSTKTYLINPHQIEVKEEDIHQTLIIEERAINNRFRVKGSVVLWKNKETVEMRNLCLIVETINQWWEMKAIKKDHEV
jgi:hypothetical protein